MQPFWTNRPALDAVHPELRRWIHLGAIPAAFNKANIELGFSPAACHILATTLSKLLVERSQHAYTVHRALNLEKLRARPPPLPGEPISSGVPDPA